MVGKPSTCSIALYVGHNLLEVNGCQIFRAQIYQNLGVDLFWPLSVIFTSFGSGMLYQFVAVCCILYGVVWSLLIGVCSIVLNAFHSWGHGTLRALEAAIEAFNQVLCWKHSGGYLCSGCWGLHFQKMLCEACNSVFERTPCGGSFLGLNDLPLLFALKSLYSDSLREFPRLLATAQSFMPFFLTNSKLLD